MQDRMSMRDEVEKGLGWARPQSLTKPDYQEWREMGDIREHMAWYRAAPREVLRNLRGFVCRKGGAGAGTVGAGGVGMGGMGNVGAGTVGVRGVPNGNEYGNGSFSLQ